jgi:hypothetical protein
MLVESWWCSMLFGFVGFLVLISNFHDEVLSRIMVSECFIICFIVLMKWQNDKTWFDMFIYIRMCRTKWFEWCLRPQNSFDWKACLFSHFSLSAGKTILSFLSKSESGQDVDKTLTRRWQDIFTALTPTCWCLLRPNHISVDFEWVGSPLSFDLFVGMFPHKVFHIHLVDAWVLLLRFLEHFVDWAQTRFKIVIEFYYDVFSGQSPCHIL